MAKREIQGSRALVTGASSGIGRALALELTAAGADLVITGRREDRLCQLGERIRASGGRVATVAGDITDPSVRQQLVSSARNHYGGLDLLVNNAGVGALGLFEHATPERMRRVLEVNFFAVVELIRLALPLLKQGHKPMVVNIGSVLGHRGAPYNSEYSASKFALHGFSQSIRAEFTRLGIDVLVVSPGTTQSEFFDNVLERTGEPTWPEHKASTAEALAARIVRAIRAGRHEVIPYGWGWLLCWLNRLSPQWMDRIMARYV